MPNQESSDKQYIHIIKASAGSGKTHRLTGDYLRLLFSGENNYRHILAVTFTNKATEEMKSRIVEELHKLSSGEKSGYLEDLQKDFLLSETIVRQKARTILETILHDYSSFSISTIDKFFQQTMRAFTREMGLAGGYNIEVDETPILLETIDLMLSELDKAENKALSDWLLLFMQGQIEEGKSWKIDRQVQELAGELFDETYKSFSDEEHEKIRDKKFLLAYQQTLIKIVRNFEYEVKENGEKGVNIMERFGLHYSDFSGGSRSQFSYFVKWANGEMKTPTATFINFADDVDKWTTKTTPPDKRSAIQSAYSNGLNEAVNKAVWLFNNNTHYNTALSILRNFYTLGILNDIKNRMRALQQENNTLFLSDTTELLNDIISDNDSHSPFIYEKTGTRINNYMIDEFQDTSQMQWENFKPLMSESISANNFNLIVGDVKQSIYRFRNSDWRLLEEQVTKDFRPDSTQQHVLDTNWRSDANIIHFNNAFFAQSATHLQKSFNDGMEQIPETEFQTYASTKITDAYKHVYQLVPDKKLDSKGQVKITFLQNDEDKDWKTKALEQLPHEIDALRKQGFALKDIAIVVRWNNEAMQVAETLLKYNEEQSDPERRYNIISNEALIIGNAQSVKAAIALMRHFRNPKDETRKMMAVYEFYRFHRNISPDEAIAFYREKTHKDFPEEVKSQLKKIALLPFYEMVEAFFALSEHALNEKENAYVQAFLDIVLKFSTNSSSDLNYFLDWWDEKGHKKALFSPDGQDAIRLITIHKSKGLGFDAVIMPFVNWSIDHSPTHTDIIWCKPTVEPFNAMSVLPLKYGKALADTIFRDDYLKEKLYTYIDNLNLLYVAFTRAKNRLITFAPTPKKTDSIVSVADLLWKTVSETASTPDSDKEYISLNDYFSENDEETVFELGEPSNRSFEEKTEVKAPLDSGKWQSIPFENRLKLRLNSIGFFSDDGSRAYGTLMHDLISRVETIDDLAVAVEEKVLNGELQENEKSDILRELTDILSIPEVKNWYSVSYSVLNETQLLHPNFGFSRPDRVMIDNNTAIVVDYKFGELENPKYNRQVQYYMKTIKEMGFSDVKGFVFYVKQGKVVEV